MKINFINQIKTLPFFLFIIIGVPFIMFIRNDNFNDVVCYILIGVSVLPLYLYFEYVYFSLGVILEIDNSNNSINFRKFQKTYSMSVSEIVSVEKYCSFPIAEGRTQWTPIDSFFYYQITTSKGVKLIVPCLVSLELNLLNKKEIIKKKVIASILFNRR
jgi:hypothetical protein